LARQERAFRFLLSLKTTSPMKREQGPCAVAPHDSKSTVSLSSAGHHENPGGGLGGVHVRGVVDFSQRGGHPVQHVRAHRVPFPRGAHHDPPMAFCSPLVRAGLTRWRGRQRSCGAWYVLLCGEHCQQWGWLRVGDGGPGSIFTAVSAQRPAVVRVARGVTCCRYRRGFGVINIVSFRGRHDDEIEAGITRVRSRIASYRLQRRRGSHDRSL